MFKPTKVLAVVVTFLLIQPAFPCTIFNSVEGDWVLAGNNEDASWSDPYIQFWPANQNVPYGSMFLTNDPDNGVQGGMNDQGLFFDCNAVPDQTVEPDPGKDTYQGSLRFYMLRHCATIEDVLDMYDQYNEPIFWHSQIHWVDATGASAVCGYNDDEEEQQCLVKSGVPYQVSTNFNVLTSTSTDWRYDTATEKLDYWRNISEALFSWTLYLVHQGSTIYSNVADLNAGKMYFHCHHPSLDIGNVAVVDLATELALGNHTIDIDDLTYDPIAEVWFPGVSMLVPANFYLQASKTADLTITFQRPVYKGSGGNITIKKYQDDSTVEVIDIDDVTGFGTKTLTINPSQNFGSFIGYYVLIDDTCLADAYGHTYHGMTGKQSWCFRTGL